MPRRAGFALLELIITIAIMGIIASVVLPLYRSYELRSDLNTATEQIRQGLARARLLSQSGKNDANWGFYIPTGVLYQGDSYATRDMTYDETYPMPSTVTAQGLLDVVYSKIAGVPSATGAITLTTLTGDQTQIDIRVEKQAVPIVEGDLITICHNDTDNPDAAQTLNIQESEWPAHQSHGDTQGACPDMPAWLGSVGCDTAGAGKFWVNDDWSLELPGADPDASGPATSMGIDAFSTIQAAVNAASAGGKICVTGGTYAENISFDKNLTIAGVTSERVNLNGSVTVGTTPTSVALYGMSVVAASALSISLPAATASLTLSDIDTSGSVSGGSVDSPDTLNYYANNGSNVFNLNASTYSGSLAAVTTLTGVGDINIFGLDGNDVIRAKPHASMTVDIDGGAATTQDKLVLDMTSATSTSAQPVVVDTVGLNAKSATTLTLTFASIEDLDLIDSGPYNVSMNDFYMRTTDNSDAITVTSAAQVDPSFRVRFGSTYFPLPSGNYGPYSTANSKMYIVGRGAADTLTMYNTRLDGVIFGGAGDDIVTGGYGNDLLIGNDGIDRISGASVGGNDQVWGDNYNPATDTVSVASQDTSGSNDTINTFGGNDVIYGQGGADTINTGNGNDYISGGAGNDLVDAQGGDDRIYGGAGDDVLTGSDGNDVVAGNDGNDTLYGRTGYGVIIGGPGTDTVNGDTGADVVMGDESTNPSSLSLALSDTADAGLLSLINAWIASPILSSLGSFAAVNDSSLDTLYGGTAADAFFLTGSDNGADYNAPGYGPDL